MTTTKEHVKAMNMTRIVTRSAFCFNVWVNQSILKWPRLSRAFPCILLSWSALLWLASLLSRLRAYDRRPAAALAPATGPTIFLVNIRIARPRNGLWRAILRRAILSSSFIKIARPIHFIFCVWVWSSTSCATSSFSSDATTSATSTLIVSATSSSDQMQDPDHETQEGGGGDNQEV